jgi:1-deoxy-D-xylulose-5-phosphate synthase
MCVRAFGLAALYGSDLFLSVNEEPSHKRTATAKRYAGKNKCDDDKCLKLVVLCPASCSELSHMLTWAVQEYNGPVAIRYPRGKDLGYKDSAWQNTLDVKENGALSCHRIGKDLTIITYGTLLENAMDAAKRLSEQGIETTVLRLLTITPLPVEAIREHMSENKRVFVVEETNSCCGVHAPLAALLYQKGNGCAVDAIDLGTGFVSHGSLSDLHRAYGMDGQGIANYVMEVLHRED